MDPSSIHTIYIYFNGNEKKVLHSIVKVLNYISLPSFQFLEFIFVYRVFEPSEQFHLDIHIYNSKTKFIIPRIICFNF